MVLKKQTVWLITMLSLLIVLSVYYMSADPSDQMAIVDDNEGEQDQDQDRDDEGDADENFDSSNIDVTNLGSDQMFSVIRMEMEDIRSEIREELSTIVASSTATTEEKNQAIEQIHELQTIGQKESMLEREIKQQKQYADVLVRKEDDFVSVTVIAEELSAVDANHIMQMARDEFGVVDVRVKLQTDDV